MKKLKKTAAKAEKYIRAWWHHARNFSLAKAPHKTIVVCCNGIFPHGGLVDRIKGVITFYEIAKKCGYEFKICFNHPFDLEAFLEPNQVDWRCTGDTLKFNPFETEILYLMDDFDANPLSLIQKSRSRKFMVYCNIDHLKKINPELTEGQTASKWRDAFNELFKKSEALDTAIGRLPTEKRIVFHSRFASIMGDFKDSSSGILPGKKKKELLQELLWDLNGVVRNYPDKAIYLLSDSVIFLDFIKQNTAYKTLEGTPKHSGISNNDATFDSHMKTLTDFFFLAESDEIFLLRRGGMYSSAFSKYAAILGNKPFKIVE